MGTGWLGWSADATLDTPMVLIVQAHAGRVEMLNAIFGGSKDKGAQSRQRRAASEPRYLRGQQMVSALNALSVVHAKKA